MTQESTGIIPIHVARSIAPDYLKLILLPTEKCNLRCTYCYEDFEIGRMEPAVVQGVKNLITKRGRDLHVLHVSWFGGEPLLAPREIIDISTHAQNVARENPGLRFQSSMTTNGVLLDLAMARKMAEVGVEAYQISLDGPRDMHNQSRITVNGGGTYDTIWANLANMADTDLEFMVNLRIHYRLETWKDLFPLLADIKSSFGDDPRFNAVFNPIVRMGGKNDDQISRIGWQEKQEIVRELYARVGQDVDRGPASEMTDRAQAVCYAATANSLVVRANGLLNKCTVALNDDRNTVGHIKPDGTLDLNREKYLPWLKGLETQDAFSLSCPYSSHIKQMPSVQEPRLVEVKVMRNAVSVFADS